MNTAILRAVEVAGSQTRLAQLVGCSQQAVAKWIVRGRAPAERVLSIEAATNGAVTRHDLRPDLYPVESHGTSIGAGSGAVVGG